MSTIIGRLADPPLQSLLVDTDRQGKPTGLITRVWNAWLLALTTRISAAATVLRTTQLLAQVAAVVTTAAYTTSAAGLYRVTYCLRVTQAATTSSSLTVTLGWVRSTVGLTLSGSALVNGGPASAQTQSMLVRADRASDLTFAVAYVSVGATPVKFELDVVVEQVPEQA
jgi:hypothetical protein